MSQTVLMLLYSLSQWWLHLPNIVKSTTNQPLTEGYTKKKLAIASFSISLRISLWTVYLSALILLSYKIVLPSVMVPSSFSLFQPVCLCGFLSVLNQGCPFFFFIFENLKAPWATNNAEILTEHAKQLSIFSITPLLRNICYRCPRQQFIRITRD